MKYTILKLLGLPVICLVKLVRPFRGIWKRVYFTARLAGEIKDMDYSVQCDGRVHVSGTREIHLGRRCRLGMETELRTMEDGKIHLGDDTRVNRGCTLTSYSEIYIDNFTIIGEFVSIRDANHGMAHGEPMRGSAGGVASWPE